MPGRVAFTSKLRKLWPAPAAWRRTSGGVETSDVLAVVGRNQTATTHLLQCPHTALSCMLLRTCLRVFQRQAARSSQHALCTGIGPRTRDRRRWTAWRSTRPCNPKHTGLLMQRKTKQTPWAFKLLHVHRGDVALGPSAGIHAHMQLGPLARGQEQLGSCRQYFWDQEP